MHLFGGFYLFICFPEKTFSDNLETVEIEIKKNQFSA